MMMLGFGSGLDFSEETGYRSVSLDQIPLLPHLSLDTHTHTHTCRAQQALSVYTWFIPGCRDVFHKANCDDGCRDLADMLGWKVSTTQ